MDRVIAEMERVETHEDPDAVHDLRVALRRCRSLAKAMSEVDPHPAWRQLRKTSRKIFRQLGALRDAQVLTEWVTKLGLPDDPVTVVLKTGLAERERDAHKRATSAVAAFDEQQWRELRRVLQRRSGLVPPESPAARCLALERYEEAHALHEKARHSRSAASCHALRIGIKQFRYTVESFLPGRCSEWEDELKRVQDLLGEVHDLDELSRLLREERSTRGAASLPQWREALARERAERLSAYRRTTRGKQSPWLTWRKGLPSETQLGATSLARLNVTAAALDPQPRKSREIEKLSLSLFDAMGAAGVTPLFRDRKARQVLRAAARLHNIGRSESKKGRHKAAQKIISRLVPPPGWSSDDLAELAWIVRFHRGPEPTKPRRGFSELPSERHGRVMILCGLIRLARALRRAPVEPDVPVEAELSFDGIVLRVPGLADTQANAARLAAGKHVLETALGRALLIKPIAAEGAASAQAILTPLAG
ncbi:MAG: CHAD domain-containing protein [Candidatus Acidiferrales bacterium]|jgi:CHAD domain-containing protein